ncbi:MAG: hypothetical protein JW852_02720 [Spirochaetales bacterium]|nr:hypothetical protein [Spirochaetales bacterium]
MSLIRILFLVAAGVAVYWLIKKRGVQKEKIPDNLEWQRVFRSELSELRNSVPAGYYVNLLALSRSRISKEECVARLDELVIKMKEEAIDTQPVETLILKLEQDFEVH